MNAGPLSDQAFWDACAIAALGAILGRDDLKGDSPEVVVGFATELAAQSATALSEARRARHGEVAR
jgi:hypothetical protein